MKPTMTILVCVLAAGLAAAQSPLSVIQNTRTVMNGVRDNSAAASSAALGIGEKAPSAASATHTPAQFAGTPVSGARRTRTPGMRGPRPGHRMAPHKSAQAVAVPVAPKPSAPVAAPVSGNSASASPEPEKAVADDQAAPDTRWSGKRDPFISPVISRASSGSGCSTGKKCLEIGTINLRGVVHSESGFIAVVSNSLNKAYFLRENDPVFNGYVMKITGDSIVFQETLQDRLGKSFTREVVKKITTPAV